MPFALRPNVSDVSTPHLIWRFDIKRSVQDIRNIWPLYRGLFVGV